MTMKTAQLEVWEGKFGEEYTDRAIVDVSARKGTFEKLLMGIPAPVETILEVGCGKGDNLTALKELGYIASGVEPLHYALVRALEKGHRVFPGSCFNIPFRDEEVDLTFTAGVLMHVIPEDMRRAVQELWRVTKKFLLIIEYYAPEELSIIYRGHEDLLWKRDYSIWGKNLIKTGQLDKASGFDNCTYWLFQK